VSKEMFVNEPRARLRAVGHTRAAHVHIHDHPS
jgi:hypothetical protein